MSLFCIWSYRQQVQPNYNTFLQPTICSFLARGKSGIILFFDIWPWNVKGHLDVLNKTWFDPDRRSDCFAFGESRSLLSWLEPELCPFEDKMLSRIPWPMMTPISDLRGQKGQKVGVWRLLARGSVYAKFKRNQKGSVLFLIDLAWNDPRFIIQVQILVIDLHKGHLGSYDVIRGHQHVLANNARLKRTRFMGVVSLCLVCHDAPTDMKHDLLGSTFDLRWSWPEVKY